MPKITLTISSKYLPTWGLFEGVRELIQNARDAEVEHNASMTVTQVNEVLRIENEGSTLPLKALLLGETSKDGNNEMIGKFGEGLKLGILALVRAGHAVKIRNGSDVWVPSLTHDERFGEEVLCFDIQGGREPKNRVRFEIEGITKALWEEMKPKFLFLTPKAKDDRVQTHSGTLLLDPKFKGCIYVKGIFVQRDPSMNYGYDLRNAEVDRDRKMIESWNLKYHTKNILNAALSSRSDLFSQFDELLSSPTTEVDNISDSDTYGIPDKAVEYVAAKFLEKHGPDAVPVQSLSDSADVEHLGKKGVLVSKQLAGVLGKKFGGLSVLKDALSKECTREYAWGELDAAEQKNLEEGIYFVNAAIGLLLSDVKVVDFRSESLMGQFKDGTVFVAKKHLVDQARTLEILVHEVAHRAGTDGSHSHVARIERIWSGIVSSIRNHTAKV